MNLPHPIQDVLAALRSAPEVWIIFFGLNVLGVVLQKTPLLPNRFNPWIPVVLYALGMGLTDLLVPTTIFPPDQKHPMVLLLIIGFLIGFTACFLHDLVIQWLVRRFLPGSLRAQNQNPGNNQPQ